MKITNRYIIKTLFKQTLSVLVILLGIYSFFSFLGEVAQLGKADYTLAQVAKYILLTLPSHLYELTPSIILIGVILGLASLAKNSELVVLRSFGLSIFYFVKQVLKAGAIFVCVAMLIGEVIAPRLDYLANIERTKALKGEVNTFGRYGFWIRDDNTFINVKQNLNSHLYNISFFNSDQFTRLNTITRTHDAVYDGEQISLNQSEQYHFEQNSQGVVSITQELTEQTLSPNALTQQTLNAHNTQPEHLSLLELYRHINFLQKNQIDSEVYEVAFYQRTLMPVTLFIMLLLAVPFVFGSLRDSSLSRKVFIGIIISIVFQLITQLSTQSALFFSYSAFVGAFAPIALVSVLAFYLLSRVSKE